MSLSAPSLLIEDVEGRRFGVDYSCAGRWTGVLKSRPGGAVVAKVYGANLDECRTRMGKAIVEAGILIRSMTDARAGGVADA
jgi:hypothetical protein